jgi:hypothetical protein
VDFDELSRARHGQLAHPAAAALLTTPPNRLTRVRPRSPEYRRMGLERTFYSAVARLDLPPPLLPPPPPPPRSGRGRDVPASPLLAAHPVVRRRASAASNTFVQDTPFCRGAEAACNKIGGCPVDVLEEPLAAACFIGLRPVGVSTHLMGGTPMLREDHAHRLHPPARLSEMGPS